MGVILMMIFTKINNKLGQYEDQCLKPIVMISNVAKVKPIT